MNRIICVMFLFCFLSASANHASAASSGALFDIEDRRALLQTQAYSTIRNYCMAKDIKQPAKTMPKPFDALKATKGYGSDDALEDFNYYLMVHTGRALAVDQASERLVKTALLTWSKAHALEKTDENYDTYYALKRGLLPIITSYEIISIR